jgi:hypothetical protein
MAEYFSSLSNARVTSSLAYFQRLRKAPRSLYLAPTHSPCNSISMKSLIMSLREHTRSCCSIARAGIRRTCSTCPKTTRRSSCPRVPRAESSREHLAISARKLLSNRVFETYNDTSDAACQAWHKLITQPQTIISIGMPDWAHVGQSP